jgi:hypothetical protein
VVGGERLGRRAEVDLHSDRNGNEAAVTVDADPVETCLGGSPGHDVWLPLPVASPGGNPTPGLRGERQAEQVSRGQV